MYDVYIEFEEHGEIDYALYKAVGSVEEAREMLKLSRPSSKYRSSSYYSHELQKRKKRYPYDDDEYLKSRRKNR